MAGLREAHLRYLLVIYELGKSNPDVGTQAAAKVLNLAPLFCLEVRIKNDKKCIG